MTATNARQYTDAPFSELRYAYLSAIARAWIDEDFLKELVDAGHSGRGLAFLEKKFEFTFPWDIELVMDINEDLRPEWDPESGFLWRAHASPDEFIVPLPEFQGGLLGQLWGPALAAYCRQFPTMLGQSGLKSKNSDDEEITRPWAEAPADFAAFGVTTARVIAAVWTNKDMAKKLKDAHDDKINGGVKTVQYVENWTEKPFPWNFRLRFSFYDVPTPRDLSGIPEWAESIKQPKTRIHLNIPKNPLKNSEPATEDYLIQPVALAAYNGTGDAYPFSCV